MKRLFVTGTDTEVGKTTICCGLLALSHQLGIRALGCKPIAAGAEAVGDALVNEDAVALAANSSFPISPAAITGICYRAPIAPHIAAQQEQRAIDLTYLTHWLQQLATQWQPELLLVEGAGGWRVPLSEPGEYFSDLPKQAQLPVVMVVGLRLGCLNHALLTAEAIAHDGLQLVGWVGSAIDPDMPYREHNINTLNQSLMAPCLGIVPYQRGISALDVASTLDPDAWVQALQSVS